jgi:hypothetical protein
MLAGPARNEPTVNGPPAVLPTSPCVRTVESLREVRIA